MSKLVIGICTAAVVSLPVPLAAQEVPSFFTVYGSLQHDSIQGDCSRSPDGTLTCDFVQTVVSKKADDGDLAKALSKVDDIVAQMKAGECDWLTSSEGRSMQMLVEALESNTPPEALPKGLITDEDAYRTGITKMPDRQRKDVTNMLRTMIHACDERSPAAIESMIKATHDMSARTCKVYSHAYSEDFTLSSDGAQWVHSEGPTGACGEIRITVLERPKDAGFKSFWNMTTRKIITNKSAKWLGDISCSEKDERQFLYSWGSEDWFAECDYIEFGM